MSAYTTADLVADVRAAQAIQERTRNWLHAELTAAGLSPDVRPHAVTPNFVQDGSGWQVTGSRSWCGNAGLSGGKSLLLIVRENDVLIFCQSYSGSNTFSRGRGQTVAEAVSNLLAQPKHGVPKAFLSTPEAVPS